MCWSGCRRFPRDTYGREIEVTCESHSNRIHLLANHGPRLGSDRKSTAGMPPMKQKIGIGTACNRTLGTQNAPYKTISKKNSHFLLRPLVCVVLVGTRQLHQFLLKKI